MAEILGLSEYGFKAKDFHQIKNELESELRNTVDPNLRFTPDTIAGQLTAIVANQTRQVWEMAAGIFASLDANTAHGRALDALCALTGTSRRHAERSRVRVLVRLAGCATLPKDSIAVLATNANARFRTIAEVKNDSSEEGIKEAEMWADEVGPIYAKTASSWEIVTPQAGWLGLTNPTDAILGCYDEGDDALRLRRLNELRTSGSSTRDALQQQLGTLQGVQAVYIEEGVHSFTVYVMGGDELEICKTIWRTKPLGVTTSGSITHAIKASNGQEHSVSFSRPLLIPLSLHIKLRVKSALNPDELAALKTKINEYTQSNIKLGDDPYPSRLYAILFTEPKILDALSIELRRVGSPEPAPTVIRAHELAGFDAAQIFIEQVVA